MNIILIILIFLCDEVIFCGFYWMWNKDSLEVRGLKVCNFVYEVFVSLKSLKRDINFLFLICNYKFGIIMKVIGYLLKVDGIWYVYCGFLKS